MSKKEVEMTKAERAICDICGATFKDKRGLAGHRAGRHGVRSAMTGAVTTTKQELETSPNPDKEEQRRQPSDEDNGIRTITVPVDGMITTAVTLPADAYTYYNMARAVGVEPSDIDFEDWLWDCIKARFAKDYRLQILIAGLPEDE